MDYLPLEKWIVLLRDNGSIKKNPRFFFRQFLARDFYQAYDTLRSYAERSSFEIVWFKSKRECPEYYSKVFPYLEIFCTYCNRKFNYVNQVECNLDKCNAILCSKVCIKEHIKLKHSMK